MKRQDHNQRNPELEMEKERERNESREREVERQRSISKQVRDMSPEDIKQYTREKVDRIWPKVQHVHAGDGLELQYLSYYADTKNMRPWLERGLSELKKDLKENNREFTSLSNREGLSDSEKERLSELGRDSISLKTYVERTKDLLNFTRMIDRRDYRPYADLNSEMKRIEQDGFLSLNRDNSRPSVIIDLDKFEGWLNARFRPETQWYQKFAVDVCKYQAVTGAYIQNYMKKDFFAKCKATNTTFEHVTKEVVEKLASTPHSEGFRTFYELGFRVNNESAKPEILNNACRMIEAIPKEHVGARIEIVNRMTQGRIPNKRLTDDELQRNIASIERDGAITLKMRELAKDGTRREILKAEDKINLAYDDRRTDWNIGARLLKSQERQDMSVLKFLSSESRENLREQGREDEYVQRTFSSSDVRKLMVGHNAGAMTELKHFGIKLPDGLKIDEKKYKTALEIIEKTDEKNEVMKIALLSTAFKSDFRVGTERDQEKVDRIRESAERIVSSGKKGSEALDDVRMMRTELKQVTRELYESHRDDLPRVTPFATDKLYPVSRTVESEKELIKSYHEQLNVHLRGDYSRKEMQETLSNLRLDINTVERDRYEMAKPVYHSLKGYDIGNWTDYKNALNRLPYSGRQINSSTLLGFIENDPRQLVTLQRSGFTYRAQSFVNEDRLNEALDRVERIPKEELVIRTALFMQPYCSSNRNSNDISIKSPINMNDRDMNADVKNLTRFVYAMEHQKEFKWPDNEREKERLEDNIDRMAGYIEKSKEDRSKMNHVEIFDNARDVTSTERLAGLCFSRDYEERLTRFANDIEKDEPDKAALFRTMAAFTQEREDDTRSENHAFCKHQQKEDGPSFNIDDRLVVQRLFEKEIEKVFGDGKAGLSEYTGIDLADEKIDKKAEQLQSYIDKLYGEGAGISDTRPEIIRDYFDGIKYEERVTVGHDDIKTVREKDLICDQKFFTDNRTLAIAVRALHEVREPHDKGLFYEDEMKFFGNVRDTLNISRHRCLEAEEKELWRSIPQNGDDSSRRDFDVYIRKDNGSNSFIINKFECLWQEEMRFGLPHEDYAKTPFYRNLFNMQFQNAVAESNRMDIVKDYFVREQIIPKGQFINTSVERKEKITGGMYPKYREEHWERCDVSSAKYETPSRAVGHLEFNDFQRIKEELQVVGINYSILYPTWLKNAEVSIGYNPSSMALLSDDAKEVLDRCLGYDIPKNTLPPNKPVEYDFYRQIADCSMFAKEIDAKINIMDMKGGNITNKVCTNWQEFERGQKLFEDTKALIGNNTVLTHDEKAKMQIELENMRCEMGTHFKKGWMDLYEETRLKPYDADKDFNGERGNTTLSSSFLRDSYNWRIQKQRDFDNATAFGREENPPAYDDRHATVMNMARDFKEMYGVNYYDPNLYIDDRDKGYQSNLEPIYFLSEYISRISKVQEKMSSDIYEIGSPYGCCAYAMYDISRNSIVVKDSLDGEEKFELKFGRKGGEGERASSKAVFNKNAEDDDGRYKALSEELIEKQFWNDWARRLMEIKDDCKTMMEMQGPSTEEVYSRGDYSSEDIARMRSDDSIIQREADDLRAVKNESMKYAAIYESVKWGSIDRLIMTPDRFVSQEEAREMILDKIRESEIRIDSFEDRPIATEADLLNAREEEMLREQQEAMEMLAEEQERAVNEYYDTDISFEELPFTGGDIPQQGDSLPEGIPYPIEPPYPDTTTMEEPDTIDYDEKLPWE